MSTICCFFKEMSEFEYIRGQILSPCLGDIVDYTVYGIGLSYWPARQVRQPCVMVDYIPHQGLRIRPLL
jgi:hypothetical protein